MVERLSSRDDTFERGYGIHADRYEFAARFCRGKTVLDAGCGIGYGAAILARRGAARIVGIDRCQETLGEAREAFRHPAITFLQGDLERLTEIEGLPSEFDMVVNLENIEHLSHPEAFLSRMVTLVPRSSQPVLVVSTPNGELTEYAPTGAIANHFHVREYTGDEFKRLLEPFFGSVELFGQWLTPAGRTRRANDRLVFEQLCEAYFNPMSRLGRLVKRIAHCPIAPSPRLTSEGDSFPWEYQIEPLAQTPYPWPPEDLLAVCAQARHEHLIPPEERPPAFERDCVASVPQFSSCHAVEY
jgi:SAM-dependent methyltransferase